MVVKMVMGISVCTSCYCILDTVKFIIIIIFTSTITIDNITKQ